jgi:hypothetical protein
VPPLVAYAVSVTTSPAQTIVSGVATAVTAGLVNGATVTIFRATAVPQLLATVYKTVSVPGVTPVTIPPETVAKVSATDQVPPAGVSVSVITEPGHTTEGPAITPGAGNGNTDTAWRVTVVPHELVRLYLMVSLPAYIPVTSPPATCAKEKVVVQLPPVGTAVIVIESAIQTTDGPDNVAGAGSVIICNCNVSAAVKQELETE